MVGQLMLLLILSAVAVRCGDELASEMPNQINSKRITSKPSLVEPLYKFTANLFHKIVDPKENVIFSPLSMQLALNMLSLGLTKGSQTEKDMLKTLGYTNVTATTTTAIHENNAQLKSVFDDIKKASRERQSRRDPKVDLINFAIVSRSEVKADYLAQTSKYYGTAVRQVRSETEKQRVLDEINKWGKDAGFSGNILPKDELASAALMLLNAVRVEAYWFESFYDDIIPDSTSPLYKHGVSERQGSSTRTGRRALLANERDIKFVEFTANKQSRHKVRNEKVRSKQPDHYDELAKLEFRAISIPLIGDLTYTIIEPLVANGSSKELGLLEEGLLKSATEPNSPVHDRLSKLLATVDSTSNQVANIRMPGFEYEQEIDMVRALKMMGLERIFNAATADLGNMTPGKNLFVDKVKHQAMIEVNEKGIKAAAVTRVAVALSAILHQGEIIEVSIENPFIYVIRLNKVPLFVGHLVKV